MTDQNPTLRDAGDTILLPSDRFFVRVVPLVAGAGLAAQLTLAVENLAPFPLGQLYYGCLPSAAGDRAIVFAAYRKRFSPAETAAWGEATAVIPAFVALLGDPPAKPLIRLLTEERGLTAVAWDGSNPLPVAVLARETVTDEAGARAALVAEIRGRTALAAAPVEELGLPSIVSGQPAKGGVSFEMSRGSGRLTTTLGGGAVDSADVRDKDFLTGQRAGRKRDRLLWRSLQAALGGLAAMLVLEAGLGAGGLWLRSLQAEVRRQAPIVERIETAQALSTRIEEMTQRRLMPFEMLALINQGRPASIQFLRTTTTGLYTMEIEAQTANAADVAQYETALRTAAGLAAIETRDLRSRDGLTSFILSVTFKPESLHQEAGS